MSVLRFGIVFGYGFVRSLASCGKPPVRQSLAVGFAVCANFPPITCGRVFQQRFSRQLSFVSQFCQSILFVESMLLSCLLLLLSVSWFSYSPVCVEFSLVWI